MIKAIVFDFGRVFIFPKDGEYFGGLNDLRRVLSGSPAYKFSDHFVFNHQLLEFVKEQKFLKNFEIYLFTKGKLAQQVESRSFLGSNFRRVYTCEDLKVSKSNPNAYEKVATEIGFNPSDILYVDDNQEHTSAAESAGFSAITFRNNMQFETEFEGYV